MAPRSLPRSKCNRRRRSRETQAGGAACALARRLGLAPSPGELQPELDWKGYTWSVTNGGMAGVAAGSPPRTFQSMRSGYLHLKIQKNGDTWTAAEIFTTTRLGFGTYQWQIDGPIDTLDKNVVLGLFPYGPAAGIGADGTNEIDIEYSRWGHEADPTVIGRTTRLPATIGDSATAFADRRNAVAACASFGRELDRGLLVRWAAAALEPEPRCSSRGSTRPAIPRRTSRSKRCRSA